MSAYAAVLSLIHAVRRIQNLTSKSIYHSWSVDDLAKMGYSMLDFLKKYSYGDDQEGRNMERLIAEVAHEAEDAIENCVADEIFNRLRNEHRHIQLLKAVEENMKSILEMVMRIQGFEKVEDKHLPSSRSIDQQLPEDSVLREILDLLIKGQSSREIITIYGIGGIGKTTLARSVYENYSVVRHFVTRIWIPLSQECTLLDVLLRIFSSRKVLDKCDCLVTASEIGERLSKILYGRRYLIILDGMASLEIWDGLKHFFPDDKNMSRIIVTTRLSNVATYVSSCRLEMKFLDKDKSWELFRKTSFGQKSCPRELENIAKEIARRCKGHPLSIVVIGGLLKKLHSTKKCCEDVARDMDSVLHSEDYEEWCLNILSLSYKYLPEHLKPCFLYMGIFPENHEIRVSQLINLWIAEGFVRPVHNNKSFEEVGLDYLKELVDSNLVLIPRWGRTGDFKTCYLHDCIRNFCLSIAQEEKFFHMLRKNDIIPKGFHDELRVVFNEKHHPQELGVILYPLQCRTLICNGADLPQLKDTSFRVLDAVDINSFEGIFRHVDLRYIGCRSSSLSRVPSTISNLSSLQTIICRNRCLVSAPVEIWNMKNLRHVEFTKISLPDPPSSMATPDDQTLAHLHTFTTIVNFTCSSEALWRMRFVKKLKIKYDRTVADNFLDNLGRFFMLELLKVCIEAETTTILLRSFTYIISLKKLTLDNIELCWNDLEMFISLPKLEDFKLNGNVSGQVWSLISIPLEFRSLKSLRIGGSTDLAFWEVDNSCFPVLEIVDLGDVPHLTWIPFQIGDIETLREIQFRGSIDTTAISALEILLERENRGIEGLHVRVTFADQVENRRFWKRVESSKLRWSSNFIVEAGKL
ncbi:putative late blight resistance protein homolog R1B-16 [Andrographis paniculata]|uniref:putative late blight resistance protein homolog R1B-16 n=1 Tax=Andrographis paniculata TaxID=175694 RepID=UPI0021E83599|nr:putative late blight resistance protein homolog R1B-16 [Andrographis paniculata]